jgi:hypothetical protein
MEKNLNYLAKEERDARSEDSRERLIRRGAVEEDFPRYLHLDHGDVRTFYSPDESGVYVVHGICLQKRP